MSQSPTLARLKAEHPNIFREPFNDGRFLVEPIAAPAAFDILLSAIVAQDEKLAERDKRIDLLTEHYECKMDTPQRVSSLDRQLAERDRQLADADDELCSLWGAWLKDGTVAGPPFGTYHAALARQEARRKAGEV